MICGWETAISDVRVSFRRAKRGWGECWWEGVLELQRCHVYSERLWFGCAQGAALPRNRQTPVVCFRPNNSVATRMANACGLVVSRAQGCHKNSERLWLRGPWVAGWRREWRTPVVCSHPNHSVASKPLNAGVSRKHLPRLRFVRPWGQELMKPGHPPRLVVGMPDHATMSSTFVFPQRSLFV